MDNSKKTILCLHGALGISSDMKDLMTILQDKGIQTLTFNFSGHGIGASDPTEFRIDLFASDLDKFIKQEKLQDPIIFGYSMGGYVALYHKANFEDSNISMIFTYGTKFNWSQQAVSKELPMMVPEHLEEKFPQFAASLKTKHGDRWKHLIRSTAHMMQNLEKLDGLTREDLGEIDIPVVLIRGDQDRMVTSEETHLSGSRIQRSQIKTISHSKHELERTNLREIAEIIEKSIE